MVDSTHNWCAIQIHLLYKYEWYFQMFPIDGWWDASLSSQDEAAEAAAEAAAAESKAPLAPTIANDDDLKRAALTPF